MKTTNSHIPNVSLTIFNPLTNNVDTRDLIGSKKIPTTHILSSFPTPQAFSLTSQVESYAFINTGSLPELSTQQVSSWSSLDPINY